MSKNQKNKNLLGLVAAGATLASLLAPFAKPVQAASLTDNWSFSGVANTDGAFVAADDATSRLSIIAQTEGTEGEGDVENPDPNPEGPPTQGGGQDDEG